MRTAIAFTLASICLLGGCLSQDAVHQPEGAVGSEESTGPFSIDRMVADYREPLTQVPPHRLYTVSVDFSHFAIAGTILRDSQLSNLSDALKTHQQNHPGAEYEVVSRVKYPPNQIDLIYGAISKSGVTLRHFWVPVGNQDPLALPGKYGTGVVDITASKRTPSQVPRRKNELR